MLRFDDNLYVSESLTKDVEALKKKIKHGEFVKGVFVIYTKDDNNKPEFMNAMYFMQRYVQTMCLNIIGLADSYDNALEYLAKWVSDTEKCSYSGLTSDEFDIG